MAIGPSLPPHLVKRKRDSDSDDRVLDTEKRARTVGPALPPTAVGNPDAIDLEDDSSGDDEPGPAAPIGPSLPAASGAVTSKPRVIGPTMPPPDIQPDGDDDDDDDDDDCDCAGQKKAHDQDRDSESDDDFGPSLPPAGGTAMATATPHPQNSTLPGESEGSARPQRDDWMLAAPSDGDWTSRVDPTKLRSRKFNSGPRASTGNGSAPDLWSETPEQKRQRLENQILGIQAPGHEDAQKAKAAPGKSKEDEETERRIREYNKKNRGESLYAQHQVSRNKEEDDDPSKRAFDREKDIGGGAGISFAKKREMLSKAADFGSRFSKGSYL